MHGLNHMQCSDWLVCKCQPRFGILYLLVVFVLINLREECPFDKKKDTTIFQEIHRIFELVVMNRLFDQLISGIARNLNDMLGPIVEVMDKYDRLLLFLRRVN